MTNELTDREEQALELLQLQQPISASTFAESFEVSTDYGRQILNKLVSKKVAEKFNVNGSRTALYRTGTPEVATTEKAPTTKKATKKELTVRIEDSDPNEKIHNAIEASLIVNEKSFKEGDEAFAISMYNWIAENTPCIFAAINHAFPDVKWPTIRKNILLLETANVISIEKQGNKKSVSAI